MFSVVWSGAISNVFGPRDRVLALLNNLAVWYAEGHAMEQHISLEFSENHHEPCDKDCRAEDPYFDSASARPKTTNWTLWRVVSLRLEMNMEMIS